MPYGYYQLVRFLGMLGFALLAYDSYKVNKQLNSAVIVYLSLALLFQPFIKVVLGRHIWDLVDIIVAAGLILSLFFKQEKH
jgi:hypothetical protein